LLHSSKKFNEKKGISYIPKQVSSACRTKISNAKVLYKKKEVIIDEAGQKASILPKASLTKIVLLGADSCIHSINKYLKIDCLHFT
jgi:hypothetical protein